MSWSAEIEEIQRRRALAECVQEAAGHPRTEGDAEAVGGADRGDGVAHLTEHAPTLEAGGPAVQSPWWAHVHKVALEVG